MTDTIRMSLTDIEALSSRALMCAGAGAEAAASVGRSTMLAERDGIASHGLMYVLIYAEHLRCGKVDGAARPVVSRPGACVITVDAASGFAHPAIDAGFPLLIDAARQNGIAALAIRNSYNCGVLGHHAERIASAGLLSLCFTNAPASIAPVGGAKPIIGTNPFALGVPNGAGAAALVIDQSASVVAKSEIARRAVTGTPIPEGWAVDTEGNPTTDAGAALKGAMMPSGGYKGFGIGLMVELFAAAMTGATLGIHASPFSGTSGGPPRTGQFFIACDPSLTSNSFFADRLDALLQAIDAERNARRPGSRRLESRRMSVREGVAISRALLARIEILARS